MFIIYYRTPCAKYGCSGDNFWQGWLLLFLMMFHHKDMVWGNLSLLGDKWALWRALSALWTNPPKQSWQRAEPPPLSGNASILGAYGPPTYPLLLKYCLITLYIFHKNALLTQNFHNFDNLRTFVAKICGCDLCPFFGTFFGLKSSIRKLFDQPIICISVVSK